MVAVADRTPIPGRLMVGAGMTHSGQDARSGALPFTEPSEVAVAELRALAASSRESEIRLRQLAESIDIVFVLLQLEPRQILYISPAAERLLGSDPKRGFAASAMSLDSVHPDDRDGVGLEFAEATRAGRAATSEHRIITYEGETRWARMIATPVPNPDGPPERSVITVEDITDRVLAAEALRDAEVRARSANEAKNEFLSRMSHELRTPLNAVLGFGQLLSRELAGTEHAEAVAHILKGGRHLLDLINDVLDIARIESGEMSVSLEPVPLARLVDETIQLMQPLAADAGVTLVTMDGLTALSVHADRQRLRQILLNLISNAIKYNHVGGHVWVEWNALGGEAFLRLRDDGHGIPAEMMSRLFTPFDRLGAEGSGIEGTGIGLALTQSLTEMMGGSIAADSTLGHGSCFTVTLPVSPDSATSAEPANDGTVMADPPDATSPVTHGTLLYIEDNEPNVRVVEHVLRLRPGWRLIHAALGRLGIELAQGHRPDLVLLDLHLPDLPGRDVLMALKNHPDTCSIPVAILTADAGASQPRHLQRAGADRFLTKPLDVDEVLRLLDDHGQGDSGGS
jgi:PAS domain S-box-containing protein